MTAVKTDIGAQTRAEKVTHSPTADIPFSNVWDAIKHVRDTLTAAISALKAPQYLVAASSDDLDNERVTTNTTSILWDHTTPGQAKAVRAALTGDASAPEDGNALTLATVNSNTGSFGSSSAVATFTVNGKGLVTDAGSSAIQIDISAVTGLQSALDGKQPLDATLTAWAGITVTQGALFYGTGSDAFQVLAKDTNATRYLSNQGSSNNPSWNQVNLANGVTGDLPFSNLAQIAGLSVLGVTGSSTADVAAITAGSDHQVMRRSGTTISFGAVNLAQAAAITGTLPIGNGGTGASDAATAFGNLKQTATTGATGVVELATDAEVRSNSGSTQAITASHMSSALGAVAITNQTPATWTWTDGIYFTLTISQNTQIANPSGTETPGQTKMIYVVGNDGTDRTITFGNQYFDVPTIVDCDSGQPYLLVITCMATDKFTVSARKAW